jgi:DNA-directed RNA polymerase subunit K/omega
MNANLLALANGVVTDDKLLINMVRLRVRQLSVGHRPLALVPPGMQLADIALSEIAAGKIVSEVGTAEDARVGTRPPTVLVFPKTKTNLIAA